MGTIRRLSVEELGQRWQQLIFEFGIENLLITENFNKTKSYVVSGLFMELEEQLVICGSYKDALLNNHSVLSLFLRHDLKTITLIPYKDWYREELEFRDGVVYIEKAS